MSPHILAGLAALAALTEAHRWLQDAPAVEAQPGLRRVTQPREMTTRAAGRMGALLTQERAERRVTDIPTTPHQVPIRPALVDAKAAVDAAVEDAAWYTASALRHHHRPTIWAVDRTGTTTPAWWPTSRLYRNLWTATTLHLRLTIPALVCDCPPAEWWGGRARDAGNVHRGGCLDLVAAQVATILTTADERARLVLGVDRAWLPLGLACDTCGRRNVEAEVSSMDERNWIVQCRNGCWIKPIQEHPRARSIAVLKSMRRQHERQLKRERVAA